MTTSDQLRVEWAEGFTPGALATGAVTGPPQDGWIPVRRDDNGLPTWLWWQRLTVVC